MKLIALHFTLECGLFTDTQELIHKSVEVAFAHLQRRLVADPHYCAVWKGESYSAFQIDRFMRALKKKPKQLRDDFSKYREYDDFKKLEDSLKNDRENTITKLKIGKKSRKLCNMNELWAEFAEEKDIQDINLFVTSRGSF